MERREKEAESELCALCGEEVDTMDPAGHARVQGRTLCRDCSRRLGGVYNPEREVWIRPPTLPESLRPRQD